VNNICKICGKTFKRLRSLRLHLRVHNPEMPGESSFICPFEQCRKVFYRKTKYQDHLNIHTKSKPYKCKECERKFSSRYSLKDHEKVCSKQVTIQCDVCRKVFEHRSSVYNHKIADHSIKKYICGCGASYKYKSGLARHKQKKGHL
jgi:uncharacterized Zn-finger protein